MLTNGTYSEEDTIGVNLPKRHFQWEMSKKVSVFYSRNKKVREQVGETEWGTMLNG